MLRIVFGGATTGAAAAGAAGAVAAATTHAQAHARPIRLLSSGTPVDERAGSGGASLKIEDDWLVPQIHGEDILFTPEEIEQTMEDICGIASGGSRVYTPSETDSVEAIDSDADAVIDQANIVPAGEDLHKLMKMTNIMLNRPAIQREIMQAFQQEPELRDMMESLSSKQGCDLELLTFAQRPVLVSTDPRVEDITEDQPKNLLQALMHDIGRGLEIAGDGLAKTGIRIGNFLGRIGRWLCNRAVSRDPDEEATENGLSNADKVLGMTMCFAAVVVAVLLAKRVGFFRVALRH